MSLGERVYQMRTEKNMSQGDLAERLDVSRQSISKWENNSAVPDLDKIVKLSEIFGVSLDELVKGEEFRGSNAGESVKAGEPTRAEEPIATKHATTESAAASNSSPQTSGLQTHTVVGIVLLSVSLLSLLIMPALFIFAIPLLLCGIICLACKKHIGLKCTWAVYFCVDLYCRYAMGINWSVIFVTQHWDASMNYGRLALGWGILLIRIALVIATLLKLRREPLPSKGKVRNRALIQWAVVLVISLVLDVVGKILFKYALANIVSGSTAYNLVSGILDCCRFGFIALAVRNTLRYITCLGRKDVSLS